ncbi:MAG: transglycosylase SLT domain-containing protein [Ktedonobacteraceae bacterium]
MITPSLREGIIFPSERLMSGIAARGGVKRYIQSSISKHVILLLFTGLLLYSSYTISNNQPAVHAANPGTGNACSWYKVRWGDTMSSIARGHGSTVGILTRVNSIRNSNLIFVGQEICIPYRAGASTWSTGGSGGLLANGVVVWYDHNALQWSTRPQVAALLRQAAAHFGLPANLLLAIAWQESGWYQHVISWDGGIGVMQLMPYTAQSINAGTGIRRNPYVLVDNIYLGATYLSWLYHNFGGNLTKTISGYNEGGWAVIHRGIFNWRYVNSVLALMKRF